MDIMNLDDLHNILMEVGAVSGCHQMPERSFFIKGYQFPLCARCSGLLIGYTIGLCLWAIRKLSVPVCLILCLIMYIDWKLQDMQWIMSTNLRRMLTGIICGVGYIQIVARVTNFIIEALLKLWS